MAMNEHIEKSSGATFSTPEAAIADYEERFSNDVVQERLSAIDAVSPDDSEAVYEALTTLEKILKALTVSVLDNNGNPANVMVYYGTESNIPKEQWDEYGREFGARIHRFDPMRFVGKLKGGLETTADFRDFARTEVASNLMPKVVADTITRVLSL